MWTRRITSLAGKAQGPERAAGEDSSGVGATALGDMIQGKRVDLVWTTTKWGTD